MRKWRQQARRNLLEWGEQSYVVLALAIVEELGELAQAILEHEYEDGTPIVERNHADAFLEKELRKVREPLHWPERWVDGEYVGIVPADVSKTVNGPARVTITAAGDELLETEISLGDEMDVSVEFERLGGDDD